MMERRRTASGWLPVISLLVACAFGAPARAIDPEESPPAPQPRPELPDGQSLLFLGDAAPVFIELHVRIDGKSHRDLWERFVRTTFRDLDANGDGQLADKELNGIPTAQQLTQLGIAAAGVAKRPKETLTLEQLQTYLGKISGGPFYLSTAPQPAGGMIYGATPSETNEGQLFARLDANQDGKLAREELALSQSLRQLDLDDDEVISGPELQPTFNPFYGQPEVVGQVAASKSPFIRVTAEDAASVAQQLIERYDRGAPLDKKLSPQELRLHAAGFTAADTDANGQLDVDELRRLVETFPAHIVITIRLGKRDSLSAVEVAFPSGKEAVPGELTESADGAYLLTVGKEQVNLAAPGNVAQFAEGFEMVYKQQFAAADSDNNGYLDKTELRNNPFVGNLSKGLDRDGDGKIFEKELLAFVRQISSVAQSRTILSVVDQGRKIFDLVDQNHDGRINDRELTRVGSRISDWDDNGDGQLAAFEVPRVWQVQVSQGTQQFGGFRVAFAAYPQTPNPTQPSSLPSWFPRMDRNTDGDISRREFLGPLQQFEKFDANGDGFLDPQEAAQIQ